MHCLCVVCWDALTEQICRHYSSSKCESNGCIEYHIPSLWLTCLLISHYNECGIFKHYKNSISSCLCSTPAAMYYSAASVHRALSLSAVLTHTALNEGTLLINMCQEWGPIKNNDTIINKYILAYKATPNGNGLELKQTAWRCFCVYSLLTCIEIL